MQFITQFAIVIMQFLHHTTCIVFDPDCLKRSNDVNHSVESADKTVIYYKPIDYNSKMFHSYFKEQGNTNKSVEFFISIFSVQIVRTTVCYHIPERLW